MKKHFLAIIAFLQDINPLTDKEGKGLVPRKTRKDAVRKGIYILNPTRFDMAELEALVIKLKPHLVVEYNPAPRLNSKTGRWMDPSVFVGQPFDEDTVDDLYDYGEAF